MPSKTKQGLVDANELEATAVPKYAITPVPQLDYSKADQRFDVVSITRAINGVISARVLDRAKGEERRVRAFDGIDSFVVTEIDADDRTLTLVDASMKPVILSARAESKK